MRVTEKQILELIHESNLIEGYDSIDFDKQSLLAWKHLKLCDKLTRTDILKVQRLVTMLQTDIIPTWRGYYRSLTNTNVFIGGNIATKPEHIEVLMEHWIDIQQTADPIEAHIFFEKIHPFVDGNGRTGRLLMWWMQWKRNQPLTKINYGDRFSYYNWFKEH